MRFALTVAALLVAMSGCMGHIRYVEYQQGPRYRCYANLKQVWDKNARVCKEPTTAAERCAFEAQGTFANEAGFHNTELKNKREEFMERAKLEGKRRMASKHAWKRENERINAEFVAVAEKRFAECETKAEIPAH